MQSTGASVALTVGCVCQDLADTGDALEPCDSGVVGVSRGRGGNGPVPHTLKNFKGHLLCLLLWLAYIFSCLTDKEKLGAWGYFELCLPAAARSPIISLIPDTLRQVFTNGTTLWLGSHSPRAFHQHLGCLGLKSNFGTKSPYFLVASMSCP